MVRQLYPMCMSLIPRGELGKVCPPLIMQDPDTGWLFYDGRAWVLGGDSAVCESYDPDSNSWQAEASLNAVRILARCLDKWRRSFRGWGQFLR